MSHRSARARTVVSQLSHRVRNVQRLKYNSLIIPKHCQMSFTMFANQANATQCTARIVPVPFIPMSTSYNMMWQLHPLYHLYQQGHITPQAESVSRSAQVSGAESELNGCELLIPRLGGPFNNSLWSLYTATSDISSKLATGQPIRNAPQWTSLTGLATLCRFAMKLR